MELIKQESIGIELVKAILSKEVTMMKLESKISIADNLSKPIVRSVFKGENAGLGFTFIAAVVKRFMDSFGFSTKMTPDQIEMLTSDTLEHFDYETIEDIILFFKMARSGKFGPTNRGVDSNLIFGDWFPKYMDLKSIAREKDYERKKVGESIDARGATAQEVFKRYQVDAKKAFDRRVSDYVDRIAENMDRQILEDTIVDWEKDPERKAYVDLLKIKRRTIK